MAWFNKRPKINVSRPRFGKPNINIPNPVKSKIVRGSAGYANLKRKQAVEYAKLKAQEHKHFSKINGILQREWRYFIEIHNIAEELNEAADNLDKRKKIKKYLKEIEYFESKEQLWASVNKLRGAISDLFSSGIVSYNDKRKIADYTRKLKLSEARVLYDTVQKLEPVIAEKGIHIVDWDAVKLLTKDIIKYSQVFIAVDQELRKFIKERGYTV